MDKKKAYRKPKQIVCCQVLLSLSHLKSHYPDITRNTNHLPISLRFGKDLTNCQISTLIITPRLCCQWLGFALYLWSGNKTSETNPHLPISQDDYYSTNIEILFLWTLTSNLLKYYKFIPGIYKRDITVVKDLYDIYDANRVVNWTKSRKSSDLQAANKRMTA